MIFRGGVGLRAGVTLAAALLLGACTDSDHRGQGGDPTYPPPPPPSATTSVDPPAECPVTGVRVRSTGSDAAMGLRALGLELVNCGDRPYQLNGYPVPHVFDEQREPILLRVVNGAKEITSGFDQPPRPVTLAPGERATAVVLWRNLVTDSTVVATTGEFLTVAPAAGRPADEVDPDGPIDLGNTGRIGVSAWKKADPSTPAPTRPAPPPAPSAVPSSVSPPDSRL
ncbi:DUF4232 domain-containing protein [Micromonospora sp. WMMD1120]|uniref:DUF4232 domain-containing protein n=1 Tax=Micromonospora sp. WMMD1120 TaxID=3016106 RepID=UPI002415B416|nr:DUF4232 domain-containing protein [Micromonospora sp. WMMD1120]MDG4806508.1 DUF4232 domain-containing protein [Micromonospora sp. WMMD1120]